jgi:hypothetical protein
MRSGTVQKNKAFYLFKKKKKKKKIIKKLIYTQAKLLINHFYWAKCYDARTAPGSECTENILQA